jgi:hypothetical protein
VFDAADDDLTASDKRRHPSAAAASQLHHLRFSSNAIADRTHGITRRREMAVNQRLRPQSFA